MAAAGIHRKESHSGWNSDPGKWTIWCLLREIWTKLKLLEEKNSNINLKAFISVSYVHGMIEQFETLEVSLCPVRVSLVQHIDGPLPFFFSRSLFFFFSLSFFFSISFFLFPFLWECTGIGITIVDQAEISSSLRIHLPLSLFLSFQKMDCTNFNSRSLWMVVLGLWFMRICSKVDLKLQLKNVLSGKTVLDMRAILSNCFCTVLFPKHTS